MKSLLILALLPAFQLLADGPWILGRAVGKVQADKRIQHHSLTNLSEFEKHWHVQQADRDGHQPSWRVAPTGLHVLATGGTTIWLKPELEGPIAITYKVKMDLDAMDPKALARWRENPKSVSGIAIVPSDVNCLWMAGDLYHNSSVLDDRHYSGKFRTYHEIYGYYGSTGGRANTTTRARRYPRYNAQAQDIQHPVWTHQDSQPGAIITPDDEMTIQCVAIDGLIQYILNGKLIYEYDHGDKILTTSNNGRSYEPATYLKASHPAYTKGRFGLRLVRSAHIYREVEVWSLKKLAKP